MSISKPCCEAQAYRTVAGLQSQVSLIHYHAIYIGTDLKFYSHYRLDIA